MGLGTLREKQLVQTAGYTFRLDCLLSNGQWCMTELSTGLVEQKSSSDLWAAYETGELKFVSSASNETEGRRAELMQGLSSAAYVGPSGHVEVDAAGSIGAMRAQYVLAIRAKPKDQAVAAILLQWNRLKWPVEPPGYSTVMRWKKVADGHPEPTLALRDKTSLRGRRGPRCCEALLGVLREVRDDFYLCRNPRISIAAATTKAADRVRLLNKSKPKSEQLRIPGRKAMLSVIREVDAEEVLAARFGADKALAMMRVSLGGVKTTRPLERIEIDHTVLSIILLDDDFEPIGRAFITAAKDAFTRAVVGFYWGAENPSVVSLARCIKHSVLPKEGFLAKYSDVKNDWPCFGAAESWVIDNGLEEHANAVHQAASEGGVQRVEFSARLSPWQKPNIERYFRTQDQLLIHGLPGTTMENIAKRGDFDAKKDLLIRWSTFDKVIVKWIVDVYMQSPQRVLRNRSPYQVWNESKSGFTQFVPDRTTILECMFLRQVDGRTLDHEGIEFDCLIYNSLDMRFLRSKFGPRLKISIRVNDDDLSNIYVQVPGMDIWVRVPCLDLEYAGELTRWQHRKCKKMRSLCAEEGVALSLAEARTQIENDIATEKTAVKQGRRKAQARMKERARGGRSYERSAEGEGTLADLAQEVGQESTGAAEDVESYRVEHFPRSADNE